MQFLVKKIEYMIYNLLILNEQDFNNLISSRKPYEINFKRVVAELDLHLNTFHYTQCLLLFYIEGL